MVANDFFFSFLFREMKTSVVMVLEMMMQITLMRDVCVMLAKVKSLFTGLVVLSDFLILVYLGQLAFENEDLVIEMDS